MLLYVFLFLLLFYFGCPYLRKKRVMIAGRTFYFYVADNPLSRWVGFMFRKRIRPEEGMIFTGLKRPRFWMPFVFTDLYLLSVKDGRIIDVRFMERGSLRPVSPPSADMYIEVPVEFAIHPHKGLEVIASP